MRSTKECFLILLLFALVLAAAGCSKGESGKTASPKAEDVPPATEGDEEIDLTVVFDNNNFLDGLKTSWGFSCLIEGKGKTVLFDTGGDGDILLYNMSRLGIDPDRMDAVVISHSHGDHTGGLASLLEAHSNLEVYLPASSPAGLKDTVRSHGNRLVEVSGSLQICDGIRSTGEMGAEIKEQALVVETEAGLLVITGCAHPGIVEIVGAAKSAGLSEVLLVMGGFHLGAKSGSEIETIIADFKALGVQHVGPCHCTGDKAIRAFRNAYGDDLIKVGVGKKISTRELQ